MYTSCSFGCVLFTMCIIYWLVLLLLSTACMSCRSQFPSLTGHYFDVHGQENFGHTNYDAINWE